MVINLFNDLELDDATFDNMSQDEIVAWLEDYLETNWTPEFSISPDSLISVCPLLDGHIKAGFFTDEMWRELHGNI